MQLVEYFFKSSTSKVNSIRVVVIFEINEIVENSRVPRRPPAPYRTVRNRGAAADPTKFDSVSFRQSRAQRALFPEQKRGFSASLSHSVPAFSVFYAGCSRPCTHTLFPSPGSLNLLAP